jgi:hypothetical protein
MIMHKLTEKETMNVVEYSLKKNDLFNKTFNEIVELGQWIADTPKGLELNKEMAIDEVRNIIYRKFYSDLSINFINRVKEYAESE